MKTRFAVLKARLQDDKVFFGPLSANRRRGRKMDREDKYDGACSHTLCGCYPVDKVEEEEAEALDCMNWGVAKLSNLFWANLKKSRVISTRDLSKNVLNF